jgi:hypothetical protein
MHQTALNSTPDDPTRGPDDQGPIQARRDPTAGALATGVTDPTRSPESANAYPKPDPTAGAPAKVASDPTVGREVHATAEARRDPTS